MNLPNKLTISRIVLTFILMFFLFLPGLTAKILALVIFIAASFTDFLDGFIAKGRNISTDFGCPVKAEDDHPTADAVGLPAPCNPDLH